MEGRPRRRPGTDGGPGAPLPWTRPGSIRAWCAASSMTPSARRRRRSARWRCSPGAGAGPGAGGQRAGGLRAERGDARLLPPGDLAQQYAERCARPGPSRRRCWRRGAPVRRRGHLPGGLLRTREGGAPAWQDTVERVKRSAGPLVQRTIAERDQARQEIAGGAWWKAEQRLFNALQRCREGDAVGALPGAGARLTIFYTDLQRLTEAEQHARVLWAGARHCASGRWSSPSWRVLSHMARSRATDLGSARAYLEEWSARGATRSCSWPHVKLAHLYYLDLRPDAARRELESAAACADSPSWLMFGATVAELSRSSGPAAGRGVAEDGHHRGPWTGPPSRRATARHALSGRPLPPGPGPGPGEALLKRAIVEAEALPRGTCWARGVGAQLLVARHRRGSRR